jgi:hypothetical protein
LQRTAAAHATVLLVCELLVHEVVGTLQGQSQPHFNQKSRTAGQNRLACRTRVLVLAVCHSAAASGSLRRESQPQVSPARH